MMGLGDRYTSDTDCASRTVITSMNLAPMR